MLTMYLYFQTCAAFVFSLTSLIVILQTWNNIISIQFKDEDFTKEWKQTFVQDFEGKYKKV